MARIAGVDIPARSGSRSRSPTSSASAARPSKECATRRACPRTRGSRPDRRRGHAARTYIDQNLKSKVTCAARSPQNIKRMMEIGCYEGMRHRRGLPSAASARAPTRAPARARRRRWPARSRPASKDAEKTELKDGKAGCRRTTPKRRERKNVAYGVGAHQVVLQQHDHHLHRPAGQRSSWASSGNVGFKGSRKSTPFAAQLAAEPRRAGRWSTACAGRRGREGPGLGSRDRDPLPPEPGIEVIGIKDVTPIPHNGCRPPKRRRV